MVFLNRASAVSSPQLSSVALAHNAQSIDDYGMCPSSSCSIPVTQDDPPRSPGSLNGFGFKIRSRSNTKDSVASMLYPPLASTTQSSGSEATSQNDTDMHGPSSKSRSIFPRARKTKRHSSKLSFGSVFDGWAEVVQTRTSPTHNGKLSEGIRGMLPSCRRRASV